MSSHGGHNRVDVLRKTGIVAVLVAALLLLHAFGNHTAEVPPTALALGFVILAAFAVGELVEVVGLPHITGYLLAGLVLGPSTAHILHDAFPSIHLPPPFDLGVLNEEVKSQLLILDDLALALIALTAGGELKVESLQKGIKQILGVLGVQVLAVAGFVMAFVVLISGVVPMIALPQLEGVSLGGALALGAVLGSIALATSPAATIAVINGTGAKGQTTDTILSIVVLKDVIVVVCFSAATAVATSVLGLSSQGSFIGSMWHITQALGIGVLLGVGAHLYLRYVGSQVLLFLVGTIYTATFAAGQLHLGDEVALMFIVAGFITGNFSDQGEKLIHEVERLSLPVYVVFFTLAGAKLHLDVLWAMAGFAVALVLVRMAAVWAGSSAGARLSGASPGMRKYGWMGFISQAGLAITLATSMLSTYPGEIGEGLFSLVLGGVAINEMLGPVLLQWGLRLAGETGSSEVDEVVEAEVVERGIVPLELEIGNPWGPPLATQSDVLNDEVADIEQELRLLVRDLSAGPLHSAVEDASSLLTSLRRAFLRIHRRSLIAAQSDLSDEELASTFRAEIVELGALWREDALDRSARISRQDVWQPLSLVEQLDDGVLG
ncbi:MAG: hypothetical protein GWP91_23550, partial [Rhodobacterales bacterium]|nr:hypothetical protein [Rhodobacterales bacterium]